MQQAFQHYAARNLPAAETICRQILQQAPDYHPAMTLLASIAFECRQFEPAAQLLRRAIELAPQIGHNHSNLGLVLAALGKEKEAEAAFRRGVEIDANSPQTQRGLADF